MKNAIHASQDASQFSPTLPHPWFSDRRPHLILRLFIGEEVFVDIFIGDPLLFGRLLIFWLTVLVFLNPILPLDERF
jgi:hypothetical protein